MILVDEKENRVFVFSANRRIALQGATLVEVAYRIEPFDRYMGVRREDYARRAAVQQFLHGVHFKHEPAVVSVRRIFVDRLRRPGSDSSSGQGAEKDNVRDRCQKHAPHGRTACTTLSDASSSSP